MPIVDNRSDLPGRKSSASYLRSAKTSQCELRSAARDRPFHQPGPVTDVVRFPKPHSLRTNGHPDRPAVDLALGAQETSQHVDRSAVRSPILERHEDDFVTAVRNAVFAT